MSWSEEKTLEQFTKDRLAYINGLVKRGSMKQTASYINGGNTISTPELLNVVGEGVISRVGISLVAPKYEQGYYYEGDKSGVIEVSVVCDGKEQLRLGSRDPYPISVTFNGSSIYGSVRSVVTNEFQTFITPDLLTGSLGDAIEFNDYIRFYDSLIVTAYLRGSYGYFSHWNVSGSSWTAINASAEVEYCIFS